MRSAELDSEPRPEPAPPHGARGPHPPPCRTSCAPVPGRVAIVHDYLNQRGGAEQVVLELSRLYPDAPIYTSIFRPRSTFAEFAGRDIRTTGLDRLPFDSGFRNLFPLYPAAFRSFGEIDADVVIASSSGWAHFARAVPDALHVVYCHAPARWLYGREYLEARSRRQAMVSLTGPVMRALDRRAAARADVYVANSRCVADRIRAAYGIEATVVHPPVDTARLRPLPRGERLLVISRLLPYKRVDLVVSAARRLEVGLDVVGDGPALNELRRLAGPGVRFHGQSSGKRVIDLLESCNAVCVAGEEDFGIVAVEAQAAGKPVIAYRRGGALETVVDGVTGVLFEEQTEAALVTAIRASADLTATPEAIARNAERFSRGAFAGNLAAVIAAGRR